MDTSIREPMIMFNMYMTQFTCSHHGILIFWKITTYLDAKGKSKRTCLLCEDYIKIKTPDFTQGNLHDKVKLFSMQLKISDFHSEFYIKQIKKLAYHRSYYKILGKIMLLTLDIKHLSPHQVTSVLVLIMQKDLALILTVKYRINSLTTIVPYPWKVAV